MNLKKLSDVFPPEDIEWRVDKNGESKGRHWAIALAYITNRAIMDRLDEVCGAENWRNEFAKAPEGGVLCGLSIKIDGEWVTKWDGAENTQYEAIKGGLSSAMKRAGVQWGIGRYLYKLETTYAIITQEKTGNVYKTKDGKYVNWMPPSLPSWALPEGYKQKAKQQVRADENKNLDDEYLKLKIALVEYIEAGFFEHPENVERVIEEKNLTQMRKALEIAKEKENENNK